MNCTRNLREKEGAKTKNMLYNKKEKIRCIIKKKKYVV